jgi:catalase
VAEALKVRENPASFDDHYSQARQFWLSMSAPEKEHIAAAYTFELSKCFEQTVKERQLLALANIDAELCAEVAAGLGLPAPDPTVDVPDLDPSPALSQVGGTWPTDGRTVAIIVDPDGDLGGLAQAAAAVRDAGMLPLVVAPHGGELSDGTTVQRSFAATRSVEFDALLLAGRPLPAPDALTARDAKASELSGPDLDPRVALMLGEAFRHAKAIGAWGAGVEALELAGIPLDALGLATGEHPAAVAGDLHDLMGTHRVWDRFTTLLT